MLINIVRPDSLYTAQPQGTLVGLQLLDNNEYHYNVHLFPLSSTQ